MNKKFPPPIHYFRSNIELFSEHALPETLQNLVFNSMGSLRSFRNIEQFLIDDDDEDEDDDDDFDEDDEDFDD